MAEGRESAHKQEAALLELAQRVCAPLGLEVYDIHYRRSGPRWKLQVFLYRPTAPITLDDCEKVSRQLSRELDVVDPIAHAYDLEVSSPGLERPLRHAWHWERSLGEKANVRLRDESGRTKTIVAVIDSVEGDHARLRTDGGEMIDVDIPAVLAARIHVDW